MTEIIGQLWQHIGQMGDRYGVNAVVFACLYIAHHPLFWGTMAWLAARVRRRQRVGPIVALAVFFWVMPYAYVLVFGHGMPWWTYLCAAIILLIGGIHAFREIKSRLSVKPRP